MPFHFAEEQVRAGWKPEPELQAPAWSDAETPGLCWFAGNGQGLDDSRSVREESAVEFMEFPSLIVEREMDGPGAG